MRKNKHNSYNETIEEFYNLSKPKVYRYVWYIRLTLFVFWAFGFFAFLISIIKYPTEYWFQNWFTVPTIIVIFATVGLLKMLTDKIVITRSAIIKRETFFSKTIQITDIVDVIKPLTASNRTKSYIFILNDKSRVRISPSIEWSNPFEFYYYVESIANYVLKNRNNSNVLK